MLQSIWDLLANYELDTTEIADAINSLVSKLSPIMDVPVVGELLNALQSFAPTTTEITSQVL